MQTLPELINPKNEFSTNDTKSKSVVESISKDESDLKTTKVTTSDNQDSLYKVPSMSDWKTPRFQNGASNKPDNLIPKWQHSTSVLSSVRFCKFIFVFKFLRKLNIVFSSIFRRILWLVPNIF